MGARGPKPVVDWDSIRKFYIKGATLEALSRKFAVDKSTISKKAKKEGWPQDLGEDYRIEVNNGLLKKEKSKKPLTKEEFDVAVESGISVIREHQNILKKTRRIANKLISRLEDELDKTAEGIILEEHAKIFKMLNESASKWIELDRKSFNLDAQGSENSDMRIVEERINALMESTNAK